MGIFKSATAVVKGYFSSKKVTDPNLPPAQEEGDINEKLWKDEIVSLVNNEFERRKQDRLPFELQWRLNMNFLKGNQYCDINQYSMSIMEIEKLYYWQQREVFNHIAPIVETRLAKLGRLRPSMTVRPATPDEDDLATAKVCKHVVNSTYRKVDMKGKISNANAWSEICGSVFYKNTWNSFGGQLIGYINNEPLNEGDVETTIVPAYEIFPDNCYNDGPDKCRSIIHAKAYTVDDIKEIWNVSLTGQDVDVYSLGMTSIGTGGLGYEAAIPTVAPTILKDAETVIEYYEMPTRKYPNGRLIIVAGTELLYYGPLPYQNMEDKKRGLPFVRQNCIDNPGCFFGVSIIERCIPIQRAYNAVRNRKHEYLNRAVIGVMTYEEDSIDDTDIEQDGLAPGSIIPRKPGSAPPSFVENGSLPPEFDREEDKLMNEFIMVSGVSELSRNSQAPVGAGSGIALEILKEQDDTRNSLTAENIRNAVLLVSKQWLRLYKQFVTGPRMDRLVGKNNEVLITKWTKNDISSDDVVHETDDDLAQTPAQRKQQVMEMFQMGMFIDPETGTIDKETRSKIYEMMEFGNWEDGTSVDNLHITKAQKENMDIQNSIPINVRDFDDDVIHIKEHNKFRLSAEYSDLEKNRPDLSRILDMHVELHQQSLTMKQNIAMQQQMAAIPQSNPKIQNIQKKA